MSMKQRIWISATACGIAAALLCLAGVGAIGRKQSLSAAAQQPVPMDSLAFSPPENSPSSQFVVKAYQGQICVFQADQTIPVQNTGIWISTLPDEDQTLLKNGISVSSQKELSSLLEDYGY
jgi:hypothetical protein